MYLYHWSSLSMILTFHFQNCLIMYSSTDTVGLHYYKEETIFCFYGSTYKDVYIYMHKLPPKPLCINEPLEHICLPLAKLFTLRVGYLVRYTHCWHKGLKIETPTLMRLLSPWRSSVTKKQGDMCNTWAKSGLKNSLQWFAQEMSFHLHVLLSGSQKLECFSICVLSLLIG